MNDKAHELALEAIQKLDTGVFKIYSNLDIDRPETIYNFAKFGELLLDAYEQGKKDAIAAPAPAQGMTELPPIDTTPRTIGFGEAAFIEPEPTV